MERLKHLYTAASVEERRCTMPSTKKAGGTQNSPHVYELKCDIESQWDGPRTASGGRWILTIPLLHHRLLIAMGLVSFG